MITFRSTAYFRVHLWGTHCVHRASTSHTSNGSWTPSSGKMADKGPKGKKNKDTALDAAAVAMGEPTSNSHRPKKTHPSPSGNVTSKDTGASPLKKSLSIQPWGRKQHRETLDYSKMPLEEKRKHYLCGDKYLKLAALPTWEESHETVPYPKSLKESKYSVDSDLNKKVSLWRGDITQLEIDAIVNAANSSLLGGGGVDGAIHHAAGNSLRRECEGLRGCSTGDAKLTGGHRLPAKYILHTVGPMNRRKEKLQSCYDRCLELVLKHKIRSVAFPCIATGIYGYPNEEAAHLALSTVRRWLESHRKKVDRIIFCVFLKNDLNIYSNLLHYYFPVESPVDSTEEQSPREEHDESPHVEKADKPALKWSLSAPASTTHHTEEPKEEHDQEPERKTSSEQQAAGGVSGAAEDTTATEEMDEGDKGTEPDHTRTTDPTTLERTDAVAGVGDTTVTGEKTKTIDPAGGMSGVAEDTTATEEMEGDKGTEPAGTSSSDPTTLERTDAVAGVGDITATEEKMEEGNKGTGHDDSSTSEPGGDKHS